MSGADSLFRSAAGSGSGSDGRCDQVFCAGNDGMNETIPDKNYFRIGEVSRILQVEPYVVRYWESEFKTVKPVRTSAAQRLYRRKDVEELLAIRSLLYDEGFTIAGARKKLLEMRRNKDEGARTDYRDVLMRVRTGLKELKDFIR